MGNSLSVAEVGTTHIAQLAICVRLSVGGLWTEADLQHTVRWKGSEGSKQTKHTI